ncbi:MAG: rhomboid family intramembrane serine protease [Deltaproteobacteria bacterium]|nr:rhomboid family intramembrane serine protease [Deltaproteobacteria bacterium]
MPLPAPLARMRAHVGRDLFALMAIVAFVHVVALVTVRAMHLRGAALVYDGWLSLSLDNLVAGKAWTAWTYALLHDLDGISHVLFNLLGLYFFGVPVAQSHRRRQWWTLVGIAAAAGGLAQVAVGALLGDSGPVVGISAVTMALLTVFTMQRPDADIYLFFALRVPARYLVPIVVGLDILGALSGSDVAVFAHLGGVASGFLFGCGWNFRVARARVLALLGKGGKGHKPFTVIDGGVKRGRSWRDEPPS